MVEYQRNLRGEQLAKQILHLNGHQDQPKFVFFQPIWFFMILSISLTGLIAILKYVAIAGLLGFFFELTIWFIYFVRTRRIKAYPGLKAWFSIQVRRYLMTGGRKGGVLSRPR